MSHRSSRDCNAANANIPHSLSGAVLEVSSNTDAREDGGPATMMFATMTATNKSTGAMATADCILRVMV